MPFFVIHITTHCVSSVSNQRQRVAFGAHELGLMPRRVWLLACQLNIERDGKKAGNAAVTNTDEPLDGTPVIADLQEMIWQLDMMA
jgi:hypothetical protein